jgi:hypothetical protein
MQTARSTVRLTPRSSWSSVMRPSASTPALADGRTESLALESVERGPA